jgi:hypothetical protein
VAAAHAARVRRWFARGLVPGKAQLQGCGDRPAAIIFFGTGRLDSLNDFAWPRCDGAEYVELLSTY